VGKTVGVVAERGGFANEQGVVFGESRKIVARDGVDFDANFLACFDEVFQRLLVRRWHGFVEIHQHREVVAVGAFDARLAP